MSTSTISSKGQTTIPIEIRRRLGLKPGDRIEYVLDAESRIVLLPATRPIASLAGALKHRAPDHPATLQEMDDVIRRRQQK